MTPAQTITLRQVETLSDAAAFLDVWDGGPGSYPSPDSPDALLAGPPSQICWLAFSGTEVLVGAAALHSKKPAAMVGISVDSALSGQVGWAARILEAVESEAKELGFSILRANIFKDNETALNLFSGAGYREFVSLEKVN